MKINQSVVVVWVAQLFETRLIVSQSLSLFSFFHVISVFSVAVFVDLITKYLKKKTSETKDFLASIMNIVTDHLQIH